MHHDQRLADAETETQCFASAIREIFRGEPWDVVESHARRAWTAGQFGDGRSWEEIRDRIRTHWRD